MLEWRPHDIAKKEVDKLNLIDIKEPPCRWCNHFNPRIKTNSRGEYDGVSICSAPDMYHDFSCFESLKDA